MVDLLAAIPSVIYGLWGGLILVPAIQPVWNWFAKYLRWTYIFDGSLNDPSVADSPSRTVATVAVVLAVMILPIITSVSRDIFMQTPRLQEEAAIGLGATKWEMIKLAGAAVRQVRHRLRRPCSAWAAHSARPWPSSAVSFPRPDVLDQAAAGIPEPDHRGEHRGAIPGQPTRTSACPC